MGLVEQTPTHDGLLSHDTQRQAPAAGEWAKAAHPDDDSDPLRAARGVVVGALLGGIIWAVILWVLL